MDHDGKVKIQGGVLEIVPSYPILAQVIILVIVIWVSIVNLENIVQSNRRDHSYNCMVAEQR